MKLFTKFIFGLLLISTAWALAPAWKIQPDQSSLKFVATQNGAPVRGEFKKFGGEINFDLDKLNECRVKIIVDMNSLTTSYEDLTTTLRMAEWFNIKMFPEAVFEANQFVKTGDKQYMAKGTLTIRDKSLPIELTFTADQPAADKATVQGQTIIKRTAFGVGQGEWSSLNEVKDDVTVNFTVTATK